MFKKFLLVLLIVSIFCPISIWGNNLHRDSLWEKAVKLAANNQNWVPGEIYTKETNYNAKGKIKAVEEYWEKIIKNDNGEIELQLINYLKNGKNITKNKLKSYKKESTESLNEALITFRKNLNPFNFENQSLISIKRTNSQEIVNNRLCVVYQFVQQSLKEGDSPLSGLTWLEEDTGIPIAVKYYLDEELPNGIKEFSYYISYRFVSEQEWYPEKLVFKIRGKVAMININLISETVMDNYWQIDK